MSNTKYIKVLEFNNLSMLKSYILSNIRHMNTLNTIALVYLAACILIVFNLSDYILYTTIIISFNSIYSFISSQNLRKVLYRFNYVAWKVYLFLLLSQIFIYLILSQLIIIYLVYIPLI